MADSHFIILIEMFHSLKHVFIVEHKNFIINLATANSGYVLL